MGLPKYLYRTEPKNFLDLIKAEGFKCGKPSRITRLKLEGLSNIIPIESELALEKNWPIPDEAIIHCPRIYAFWKLETAITQSYGRANVVTRFSCESANLSNEDLYFPDGAFEDPMYATYIVFPKHAIGDVVIKPHEIEVSLYEGQWINLCDFTLLPYDVIKPFDKTIYFG